MDESRPMSLVLASASASRQALLRRLGLPFEVAAAGIDEAALPGESPVALAGRLSRAKAAAVAARHPGTVVIGSDQVAVCDGTPSGKPGSAAAAIAMLQRFSGRELDFFTGLAVLGAGMDEYVLDHTRVRFRVLSRAEIERYVAMDQPLDCAGCFRLEAAGPMLFDQVTSQDPTALLGLPLIALCRILRKAGFALP